MGHTRLADLVCRRPPFPVPPVARLLVQRWTSGGMPTSEGIPIAIDGKLATRCAKLASVRFRGSRNSPRWPSSLELHVLGPVSNKPVLVASCRSLIPRGQRICDTSDRHTSPPEL